MTKKMAERINSQPQLYVYAYKLNKNMKTICNYV